MNPYYPQRSGATDHHVGHLDEYPTGLCRMTVNTRTQVSSLMMSHAGSRPGTTRRRPIRQQLPTPGGPEIAPVAPLSPRLLLVLQVGQQC